MTKIGVNKLYKFVGILTYYCLYIKYYRSQQVKSLYAYSTTTSELSYLFF